MLLTLLTCTQTGCLVAAAAGATGATVAYVRGDLSETVSATPPRIATAAEKAAQDLKLVMVSNQSSNLDAKVVTRTARDVRVVIVAKAESDNSSRVSIRVGTFGDDSIQRQMMSRIRSNLSPTTAPSTDATTADASK
jgi:hypothetical protein